jgi:hypothetical protein
MVPRLPGGRLEHGLVDIAVTLVKARATRVEDAGLRRGDRRRNVPAEDDPSAHPRWGRSWHGRQERRSVRVARTIEDLFRVPELDNSPEVHDGDAVCDLADDGQVVGDEDEGEVELLLQAA